MALLSDRQQCPKSTSEALTGKTDMIRGGQTKAAFRQSSSFRPSASYSTLIYTFPHPGFLTPEKCRHLIGTGEQRDPANVRGPSLPPSASKPLHLQQLQRQLHLLHTDSREDRTGTKFQLSAYLLRWGKLANVSSSVGCSWKCLLCEVRWLKSRVQVKCLTARYVVRVNKRQLPLSTPFPTVETGRFTPTCDHHTRVHAPGGLA